MHILSLILPALLCAASGSATESEGWELYVGTTGNFQVLLPGTPTITYDSHSTYLGDVLGTRIETKAGPHRVTLTHQDIPRIATTLMPDSIILDRAGDSVVEANDGSVNLDRSYTWQGFAAREITYEVPGDPPRLTRARLILVESRIYMAITSWPAPNDIPSELADFLNSFALTNPGESTPPVGAGSTKN
jgi:hypothetical protein